MGLDFIKISEISEKGSLAISPEFLVKSSNDLMIRGGKFYAIWNEEKGLWSTNEDDVWKLIDKEVYEYANKKYPEGNVRLKLLSEFSSKKWREWTMYSQSLPDNYSELDCDITFLDDNPKKEQYRSKVLDYPIVRSDIHAYDELVTTIYDEEELQKLEWAVGSIIAGDSKRLQKFIVLFGGPGTGKSTYLNIIDMLFKGYTSTFESKTLGSSNASFAMEPFRNNPLVAIQHDGDLSKIEDNTRLNSIVSHETMTMNEKYKSSYPIKLHTFLFMGTNKPVKITDAKSGIIRRLIDVRPSGNIVEKNRYDILMDKIRYELGGIAQHCLDVYNDLGFHYYDDYRSIEMIGATNDIYNFIEDNWDLFSNIDDDGIVLKTMWSRYKEYCEESANPYPLNRRSFKFEMKNYFEEYYERCDNRTSVYKKFISEKFEYKPVGSSDILIGIDHWLNFDSEKSLLDEDLMNCKAQYANKDEKPIQKWDSTKTLLKDIDTTKLHYVRPPENMIIIDFDIKDENGNKSFEANLKEAEKWPRTYAELSKSGGGIHLHYYYNGDISKLSHFYNKDIEIKTFNGNSSLRRMVTKCNDIPVAIITSGLPKKEVKNVVNYDILKSEKELRMMIKKNLRKEIHPATKPSMDFIKHLLDEAYEKGFPYDVSDMINDIQVFAMNSTNQSDYCVKLINRMHFKSETDSENKKEADGDFVFFDCEVFPNLFIICWKLHHDKTGVVRMINPKPEEVEALFNKKLIGFNNRNYDNHILYARSMGYTNEELYELSQRIINNDRNSKFKEAYNLSYTDVLDFLSPPNKMGLKKWEIKLRIKHKECPYKWNEPVPENKWREVADYCCNDVEATEAVFDANPDDWIARQILAEWAGMTVNDTTNTLTTRIIVGKDPHPQDKFVYTDLSTIFPGYRFDPYGIPKEEYNPGTKIVQGKSIFMGEDPSEGGCVFAIPGIWYNVGVLDIGSMHPHSAKELNIFGPYTKNYTDIMDGRMCIKHGDYEGAKKYLPERLWHYLEEKSEAKKLGGAMKGAINPVYGLTSAHFDNKLKDPRNVDNIVAKRGALFMIQLKNKVQEMGYEVVHIKTDSIKIANIDEKIWKFVYEEGLKYGYTFEWEHTYSKMCLVNDSTYIAEVCEEDGKPCEKYWEATGAQFQVPYVYKTLFSHEPIEFYDLCETKSVTTALYLDMNEKLEENDHNYVFIGKVGSFCPILPGHGGGVLLRESIDEEGNTKYSAVNNTKKKGSKDEVYRWLEDEMVINLNMEDSIDHSYFISLCDAAIDKINEFGDFEDFVSDNIVSDEEEIPFA